MPYIVQEMREELITDIEGLVEEIRLLEERHGDVRAGVLNYAITKIIKELYGDDMRYRDINEVIGMLECCKLEVYRKMAADYEDLKEKENGKV